MDAILAALEQSALAAHLRSARWEYASVNAAHILGIALLVGCTLPLDLKLLGLWPSVDRKMLSRVLVPVAAFGLLLAVITGMMLFSVRAQEYATLSVLRLKLSIIAFGFIMVIATHLRYGIWLDREPNVSLAHVGAMSLLAWISTLFCGRLIAFVV
ncbi:MAG: hypothetical protein APF80_12625 [Alphaproteobacteria bacterium BRH_c36]|nr:MAG: hypothetical protein APF80_12625 [Alphaproteobacteria bacterium BRH_c36]